MKTQKQSMMSGLWNCASALMVATLVAGCAVDVDDVDIDDVDAETQAQAGYGDSPEGPSCVRCDAIVDVSGSEPEPAAWTGDPAMGEALDKRADGIVLQRVGSGGYGESPREDDSYDPRHVPETGGFADADELEEDTAFEARQGGPRFVTE